MSGNDDLRLPPEMCSEILTRVPIKSILRFRSVSKSWNSLISRPNFKPKTLSDRILLSCQESRGWSLISHGSESRDIGEDLPDRFRGQRLDLVGSCHGLFCFLYKYTLEEEDGKVIFSFLIYNPAIRKIVELPSLSFGICTHFPRYYGFGFDSMASDYKVMLIMMVDYDEIEVQTSYYVGFVFDLRNVVWREFTPILVRHWGSGSMMGRPEFYVNDAVHWCVCDCDRVMFILSFNLSDEKFRKIMMPPELEPRCFRTSGGLVYALERSDGYEDCFSVWVMKEYGVMESWTKAFTFDMPPQFNRLMVRRKFHSLILRGPEVAEVLLCCSPSNEECVEGSEEEYVEVSDEEYVEGVEDVQHLISYNSESGESKYLLSSTDKWIHDLILYKESLVLM